MNFKKLRVFRELKKEFAPDIKKYESNIQSLSDDELFDVLVGLKFNAGVTNTISDVLNVEGSTKCIWVVTHTLASTLGNLLKVVSSEKSEKIAEAIHKEIAVTIHKKWRSEGYGKERN